MSTFPFWIFTAHVRTYANREVYQMWCVAVWSLSNLYFQLEKNIYEPKDMFWRVASLIQVANACEVNHQIFSPHPPSLYEVIPCGTLHILRCCGLFPFYFTLQWLQFYLCSRYIHILFCWCIWCGQLSLTGWCHRCLLLAWSSYFRLLHWPSKKPCLRSVAVQTEQIDLPSTSVFVTKTGSCYHVSPRCPGNGSMAPVTELRRCRNCCHFVGIKDAWFNGLCLDGCERMMPDFWNLLGRNVPPKIGGWDRYLVNRQKESAFCEIRCSCWVCSDFCMLCVVCVLWYVYIYICIYSRACYLCLAFCSVRVPIGFLRQCCHLGWRVHIAAPTHDRIPGTT